MRLSEHFTLNEFIRSDTAQRLNINNQPNELELANLKKLAIILEKIRALLGDKPILISSGFRGEALNKAVKGVPLSHHRLGCAVDFTAPAFGSAHDVAKVIEAHADELGVGQLINEYNRKTGNRWVHLSIKPVTKKANRLITMVIGSNPKTLLGVVDV